MKLSRIQAGFSVTEMLVAMTIGLVVTASMIAVMSNSLSNTSRLVKMNKLAENLRSTMQMMSRDVRRSSYTANAVYCFGNPDCSDLGSVGAAGSVLLPGDITINESNDCLTFLLDRDQDGDATEDDAGGFRRVVVNDVGQIEAWIGDSAPDCAAADEDWVALTDADQIDITAFTVNDDQSYNEILVADGDGNAITTQKVRRILMIVSGELIQDDSITRTVETTIKVRNNLWF